MPQVVYPVSGEGVGVGEGGGVDVGEGGEWVCGGVGVGRSGCGEKRCGSG